MDLLILPELKWASWTTISILSIYIYISNPIRFSPKLFIKTFNINYTNFFNIIKYVIIGLNLLFGILLYKKNPILLDFKLWFLIITIISSIVAYEFKSIEKIDDGTFNNPPHYLNKSIAPYILIILLLTYNFTTELNILSDFKLIYFILWMTALVNIILHTYLLFKLKNFSPCLYKLPKSWK